MNKLAVVLISLFFFFSSCKDDDEKEVQPVNEVRMSTSAFLPSMITVPTGTTVKWVNNSNMNHTVTSDDDLFDQLLPPGEEFSYTFSAAGNYGYVCTIHIGMAGTVVVE